MQNSCYNRVSGYLLWRRNQSKMTWCKFFVFVIFSEKKMLQTLFLIKKISYRRKRRSEHSGINRLVKFWNLVLYSNSNLTWLYQVTTRKVIIILKRGSYLRVLQETNFLKVGLIRLVFNFSQKVVKKMNLIFFAHFRGLPKKRLDN